MNRALVRMHPRCPICSKRISDRDKVVRLARRGWVHRLGGLRNGSAIWRYLFCACAQKGSSR